CLRVGSCDVLIGSDLCCCAFFFSSRRRHTRSDRDWSSDVCSSDLTVCPRASSRRLCGTPVTKSSRADRQLSDHSGMMSRCGSTKIGRASCRERVYISVVAGGVQEKRTEDWGEGQETIRQS